MIGASQTLLLNSAFCANPTSDTPWDWSVVLAPELIKCRPNEKLRITLKRLECRALWLWIPRPFHFYVLVNKQLPFVRVDVPAGNPTFRDVAQLITTAVASPDFQCTFLPAVRKYRFAVNAVVPREPTVQLDFTEDPAAATALGFVHTSIIYSGAGERSIDSEVPLNDTPFDAVKVHVSGVLPEKASQNGSNTAVAEQCEPTDLLAAFQVDSSAFDLLEYRNTDDTFAMTITDKTIRTLHFRMTDWYDRPLTQFAPHYLYLQVDTLRLSIEDIVVKVLRAFGL